MVNINEMNKYIEDFGSVVKKLDKIAEINDKVNQVSDDQKQTMDELHRQWEETLPKISGYIKEIDVITAKFEEAARRQEEAVNKLNGNLDNIERGVGEVLLQQRNGFEATGANIEGASKELISSLDASFQNANKNISGISEQQKALADVNKKNLDIVDGKIAKAFDELSVAQVAAFQKAKTQQIITLSIAAVAAALSLIGLFVG